MIYTAEDLLDIFRTEVDDTEEDYLWTDESFFWYLDEAQREFARQTDILMSSDIVIPVVADESFITLPVGVEKIRDIRLLSTNGKLPVINYVEVQGTHSASGYGEELLDWNTSTGTPRFVIADEVTDQLRLVPQPIVNDSVTISAFRLPKIDIIDDGSILELTDSSHQRSLLLLCKAMAYEVNDVDINDTARADRYRQQFFAYTAEVKSRRNRRNRRVGTVRYGGIM